MRCRQRDDEICALAVSRHRQIKVMHVGSNVGSDRRDFSPAIGRSLAAKILIGLSNLRIRRTGTPIYNSALNAILKKPSLISSFVKSFRSDARRLLISATPIWPRFRIGVSGQPRPPIYPRPHRISGWSGGVRYRGTIRGGV
jgi:hypothetical protein